MHQYQLVFAPSGLHCAAAPGQTILAAAEAAGIVLPSSCRNGTCRTCLCKLEQGTVAYLVAWPGLSADEKAEGLILPCVAVPGSNLRLAALARRSAD